MTSNPWQTQWLVTGRISFHLKAPFGSEQVCLFTQECVYISIPTYLPAEKILYKHEDYRLDKLTDWILLENVCGFWRRFDFLLDGSSLPLLNRLNPPNFASSKFISKSGKNAQMLPTFNSFFKLFFGNVSIFYAFPRTCFALVMILASLLRNIDCQCAKVERN